MRLYFRGAARAHLAGHGEAAISSCALSLPPQMKIACPRGRALARPFPCRSRWSRGTVLSESRYHVMPELQPYPFSTLCFQQPGSMRLSPL